MYAAGPDPYCHPGTDVLRNRLGLTDPAALEAFELEASLQRASEPLPRGRLGLRHYLALHRHLFQDVYAWAGRIRTIRIAKDGSMFCYPEHIRGQLAAVFAGLHAARGLRGLPAPEFALRSAHVIAELNAIHPFREGNGRTQLAFLTLLAARAGHPLDMLRLDPPRMLAAMVGSFQGDEAPLADEIGRLLR